MDFLEKDLEEILKTTPTEKLVDAGLGFLKFADKVFTQVRIGNYGVADMITYKRCKNCIFLNVVELKKDKIGISAFLQAVRYVRGIQRFLEKRGYENIAEGMSKDSLKSYPHISIDIILIGRSIDNEGSFCYLPDVIRYSQFYFYTYEYKLDGLKFKQEYNYQLIKEGF